MIDLLKIFGVLALMVIVGGIVYGLVTTLFGWIARMFTDSREKATESGMFITSIIGVVVFIIVPIIYSVWYDIAHPKPEPKCGKPSIMKDIKILDGEVIEYDTYSVGGC